MLVAGGSGLLGNNIIRSAIARGHQVASLGRSNKGHPGLVDLDVEVITANVADIESLNRKVIGRFDAIVNSAAHIHIGWDQLEQSSKINRDGTRNLLSVAERMRSKFIQVSTVNALALGRREQPADEETMGDGQVPCTYVTTKRAADAEVARAHFHGQHVVTVHPGFMLGPWDWNPSSGKMIQALQSPLLLSPSGGCSVCEPRDVASTILDAIDVAPNGSRFILAGENLTYLDLWRRISSNLGTTKAITHMRLPERIAVALICNLLRGCTGKEGDVNSASIKMSSQFHWYDSQRAIDELGYRYRSADESISSAVQWLRNHGMLRR